MAVGLKGAVGVASQDSLPSGWARTTHGESPCPCPPTRTEAHDALHLVVLNAADRAHI
jgi:hypothetical protein